MTLRLELGPYGLDDPTVVGVVLLLTQPWHVPARDDVQLEDHRTAQTQIHQSAINEADRTLPHFEEAWVEQVALFDGPNPQRPNWSPQDWLDARAWLRLAAGYGGAAVVGY